MIRLAETRGKLIAVYRGTEPNANGPDTVSYTHLEPTRAAMFDDWNEVPELAGQLLEEGTDR